MAYGLICRPLSILTSLPDSQYFFPRFPEGDQLTDKEQHLD